MSSLNREWLNQNETRNYPIKEGLDRISSSGYIIANNTIVDLRLSGTLERFEVSPTVFNNVDYFVREIERVASTQTIIRIREIYRETYSPGNPSTFNDVGEFIIPYGQSEYQKYSFTPSGTSQVSGVIVIKETLDGAFLPGIQTFTPINTTLEARTLIPNPGNPKVLSISKEGDIFKAAGNVRFKEANGIAITPVESANGLRFDFNALRDCETFNNEEQCLNDLDVRCPQPAIMSLNNAESDRNFNFKISGSNAINVSTLPILIPGGNPLNPNDYTVNSVVVTYHGPITALFLGGDPSDFNNYTYGLNCKHTPVGQRFPSLLEASESLLAKLNSIVGNP